MMEHNTEIFGNDGKLLFSNMGHDGRYIITWEMTDKNMESM